MISSVEEFLRLIESEDGEERRRAAWEGASTELWNELIEKHPESRFWAAHNRTVPIEVMWALARDSEWRVRGRIANKNSCPPEILEELADDTDEAVVSTVSGHPNTPTRALKRLLEHPWAKIRDNALRQLMQRGEEVTEVDSSDPEGGSSS